MFSPPIHQIHNQPFIVYNFQLATSCVILNHHFHFPHFFTCLHKPVAVFLHDSDLSFLRLSGSQALRLTGSQALRLSSSGSQAQVLRFLGYSSQGCSAFTSASIGFVVLTI